MSQTGRSRNISRAQNRFRGTKIDRQKSSATEIAKEFIVLILETSSVHGFSHIAAKRRHPIENLFWFFMVLMGAYGAYFFAQSTLRRYSESPTVISLERNYKDWNTTFPSATICPSTKIQPDLSEAMISKWFGKVDNTSEIVEWLDALARANYENFDQLTIEDRIPSSMYLKVLTETAFKLSYVVSNSNSESGTMIQTMTERGICYTFNSVVAMYNNPEYWMNNDWAVNMSVNIFKGNPLEGDIFAQVMELNSGYTVNIHSPFEVPDVSTVYQTSLANFYMSIDVTAMSTVSTEETRSLSTTQRKCRFLEESNLKTTPVYSYNQCRSECRMMLAYKLCKCIPFFHRPIDGMAVCDVQGMKCLGQHKERLIKLKDERVNEDCKCLPPCNDVTYLGTNLKFGLLKYPRTRLKRDLFFTRSDLLVQLGGSASLCLGCSVLSFCEFFYLFTLRLALFLRQKLRKR
ncbi:hypothetical protein GE061_005132 [Apolygus lucorum]|uniref:Uncharacterized protein n=1 Tax=Apolygus lucorum TaxID=248454 RepID=A0A8S9WX43_APOLU|nr:hypothetical protein GE061_005132 [Apolygus lucorum]